ncbi:MAG: hypothetical protein HC875_14470 [Anaerolineales bacterium]|nr:hypothetical protein [Anaerolineales bacterium]
MVWLLILSLALITLACGFLDNTARPAAGPLRIARLPTLTPTPAVQPVSQTPIEEIPAAPVSVESAAPLPAVTPTAVPMESVEPAAVAEVEPAQPAPEVSAAPVEETSPAEPTAVPSASNPTSNTVPVQNSEPVNNVLSPQPGSALTFANVRLVNDPVEGGVLLYGDVINQSDSPQELQRVTGTFVDAQGQMIADEDNTTDYAPVQIIPTRGQVPFELSVQDIQAAADFDLRAEAQPSSSVPRQDFELTTTSQVSDEFGLCFEGTVRNPGANLAEYAVVAVVLYDAQNNVISFGDTYLEPETLASGQTAAFELCADSFSQPISSYKLQAWGL